MSSEKRRPMDDTWSPEELALSMKDKEKSKRKEREHRKEKDKSHEKDKRDEKKERRHRDRENGEGDEKRDEERRKRREERKKREKEEGKEDKENRHREKDGDRERRHRDRDGDREKRHKEKDGEREKRHRERKEEDGERKHRRHRDKGENDDGERKHRRHREEDDGEERKHRRHKDEDGEKRHRRHRDKDDDGEERRHRRHRDKEQENGEDSDRERRHRRHREERERREESTERRERRRDREDSEDRERRERRRERRKQREEEERISKLEPEPEIIMEDDKSSTKSKSAEVNSQATEDNDYNYDDEEFEQAQAAAPKRDYDDDFEDDPGDSDMDPAGNNSDSSEDETPEQKRSRAEMAAVLAAMNAENDRVNDDQSVSPAPVQSTKRPATASKRQFINFVSAKQRQITEAASSKTRRRGNELLQLIELDHTHFDLFDMPPMGEYELFMCSYGRSDTKQAYIQTNADDIDRDVQTEDPDVQDKWCQHPPEGANACGGPTVKQETNLSSAIIADTLRLNTFLDKAAHVMIALIDEESANQSDSGSNSKKSNIRLSEHYVTLGSPDILTGRHISSSHFSSVQSHLLLLAYSMSNQSDQHLGDKGVLCVWNVNEPSTPQKILMCESQPTCVCFSPSKPNLVIAGIIDGSMCLWDLREANTLHRMNRVSTADVVYRFPTYNTAGVLHYENHKSSVRSLCPMLSNDGSNMTDLEEGGSESSNSFQLASIEEKTVLNIWVVAELSRTDSGGSQSDLGLSPGGKVKLLKSSAIELTCPLRELGGKAEMKLLQLALLPSDTNHFYVTTDLGCVIHGVQYGGKAPPKGYLQEIDSPVCVSCIDFSPFGEAVFLVGCADGSIRLYAITSELPLLTWSGTTHNNSSVICVHWCRSRPSVFFVLDQSSFLHTWDLSMSQSEPLSSEPITTQQSSHVTDIALSNDHAATGVGVPGRKPQMVVCMSDGCVEIHTISQQFSALMPEEIDQFSDLIHTLN